MRHSACSLPWRRAGAPLLIALYVVGCQGWRTQPVTPAELLEVAPPTRLRVTRTDSANATRSRIVLEHPILRGDTLEGVLAWPSTAGRAPVRIPLTDVQEVATRGFSAGRTLALIVSVVSVGAVVALALGSAYAARAH